MGEEPALVRLRSVRPEARKEPPGPTLFHMGGFAERQQLMRFDP